MARVVYNVDLPVLLKIAAGYLKEGDDQVAINRKNCQRGNVQRPENVKQFFFNIRYIL